MLRWAQAVPLKMYLILPMVSPANLSISCPGMFLFVLVTLSAQRLYRGNCQLGLYCDSVGKVCKTSLVMGAACAADKEYACLIFYVESHQVLTDSIDATLGIVSVVDSVARVRLLLVSLGLGCMF